MDAGDFLSPGALVDLAVLGLASERARTAAELIGMVKRLGGARFQPTADVIAGRLAALTDAGMLTAAPGDAPDRRLDEVRWQPSAKGRAQVQRLLMTHNASPADALAAVCACLKICFLEVLDRNARAAVMADLTAAHRRALSAARAALAGCPCRLASVRRYLARDVERWEAELVWLAALAGEIATEPPLRL